MLSSWTNLVARRDLLRQLVVSELRSQTRGRLLGWLWWLVDPLVMMLIYWAVFVGVLDRGQHYAPYPIFVLCGLLPWKHFSYSVTRASNVLIGSQGLIKAIPFPTVVLPLSHVGAGFVCYLFGLGVLILAALIAGKGVSPAIAQLIPLLVAQLLLVAGISLAVAAIGVRIRDLSSAMSHFLRVAFYLTPVIYGLDMVRSWLSDVWYGVYLANPFVLLIDGYRKAIFDGEFLSWWCWPLLLGEGLVIFGVGFWIYRHYDRRVTKFL